MIKAVLFDMDGLLFDTERLYMEQWKKVSEEEGVEFPYDLFFRCVGRNMDDTKKILFDALGDDFPFETFYERTSKDAAAYINTHGTPLKKGVDVILPFLKEHKVKTALATSSDKDVAMWLLSKAGIGDYFDAHVFGDEIKNGKPAPDIYLTAAKKLGVEPGECVVLEDSAYGLQAGQRAGMKTIFIKDLIDPPQEVLDKVWKSAKDLVEATEFLKEFI